jgi:hypothetical protein
MTHESAIRTDDIFDGVGSIVRWRFFGMTRAGYPVWVGVVSAYLLFLLLNGSLAYRVRARRLKLEGKEIPPYLQYLFLPNGIPRFQKEAPGTTHLLVGVAAALTGAFFVFCGIALAIDAEWSRIPHPFIVVTICLVVAGTGAALLYLAWRLYAFKTLPDDVT